LIYFQVKKYFKKQPEPNPYILYMDKKKKKKKQQHAAGENLTGGR